MKTTPSIPTRRQWLSNNIPQAWVRGAVIWESSTSHKQNKTTFIHIHIDRFYLGFTNSNNYVYNFQPLQPCPCTLTDKVSTQ